MAREDPVARSLEQSVDSEQRALAREDPAVRARDSAQQAVAREDPVAFPRIGVSVALGPGDFLLFNPNEPHCVSSRCRADDDIYIISSYLKTAVVGLNDNSNPIV